MRDIIIENVLNLKNDLINTTIESIKIPSVIDESDSDNYVFGKDIDDCLNHMLTVCENIGFKTFREKDGYYGYAEIGEGDELIGILGHLDVVPAGDLSQWNVNPFEGVIIDNKLYGRGTQDDKGPTICAIYAVKALIDSGVKLNKRIRFIFGTDEETLWRDMAKYNENKEEMPDYGFTPDSQFPCTHAEKGLLQCIIKSNEASPVTIVGGDAFNAVPSKLIYNDKYIDEIKNELEKLNFDCQLDNDDLVILGKAVHSQSCYKGINPISRLLIALNNLNINSHVIDFVSSVIGEDCHGKEIIGDYEDVSGKLTFNIGKIDLNKDNQKLYVDVRIPVTYSKDDFVKNLKSICDAYNLEVEEYDFAKPLYMPKEHFLIETLSEVYHKETGFDPTPLTSGGATYARAVDNCVAFGAVFPTSTKTEHQPNECIDIDDMINATKIFALSINELLKR